MHVAENRIDAMTLAIKEAFEGIHIDKTMSLATAKTIACAAHRASVEWSKRNADEAGSTEERSNG